MECQTLLSLWVEGFKNCAVDCVCTLFADANGVIKSRTYKDIHETSVLIKERIKSSKCENEVIGLLIDDDGSLIAVLIGILSSNAAFHCIPKDISTGWLEYLITTLRIRVFIGRTRDLQSLLSKLPGFVTTLEEIENSTYACLTFSNVSSIKLKADIVYVITTSGTTGTPKIVWVPNRCIVPNILCFREIFKISSSDTVFQASPFTFDPSVVEIFMTLSVGAKLVVIQESLKRQPTKLGRVLKDMQVTVLQSTPTLLASMGRDFLKHQLLCKDSHLRVLALGGEKFPEMQVLRSWKGEGNQTELFNVYGITEVSSWATWCHVTEEMMENDHEIPLGRAIPYTSLKIEDDTGNQSDQGLLFIGGDRVCLIDSETELISGTFRNSGDIVRRDSSGNIWYGGRSDDQVKRLGKRLNLIQIEQVLQKFYPDMTAIAVFEEVKKALYIFVRLDNTKDNRALIRIVENIKDTVKQNLPVQYQPDHVIIVDKIPVTHHGKVDKASLLELIPSSKPSENGENWMEIIREYIMKILNIAEIPQCDALNKSFFDLGGTSFQAVHLIEYIEDATKVTLSYDIWEKLTDQPLIAVLDELSKIPTTKDSLELKTKSNGDVPLMQELTNKRHIIENYTETPESVNKRKKRESFCSNCGYFLKDMHSRDIKGLSVYRASKIQLFCNNTLTIEDKVQSRELTFISCSSNGHITKESKKSDNSPLVTAVKWKYNLGKCNDASPLVYIDNSVREVYIGSHSHRLACVDLQTGICKWEIILPDRIESSACVTICSQFVVVGCYDGHVYSVERSNGTIYWAYLTGGPVKSSPCVDPKTGLLYIGSHDQCLHCLNVQEKKCVWKQHAGGGSVFSSPSLSMDPHLIITGTLSGRLVALEPESGDIVWTALLCKPIFSSTAVTSSHVYVGCVDGSMNCFTLAGHKVWSYETNGPVFSSPCVFPSPPTVINCDTYKGQLSDIQMEQIQIHCTCNKPILPAIICFGCHDSYVYCICSDGNILWKFKTDSPVYSTPFVTSFRSFMNHKMEKDTEENPETQKSTVGDKDRRQIQEKYCSLSNTSTDIKDHVVVVSSTKGHLYVLSLETGHCLTDIDFPDEIFSSAVVVNEHIVVGCRDDYVYCLNVQ